MSTVSGARVRDELMDLLAEAEVAAAVERLTELGIDRAMDPALDPDAELVASAALGAAAMGANRALAALAALCASARRRSTSGSPGSSSRRASATPWPGRHASRRAIARELRARDHAPSELRALLGGEPLVGLALALAMQRRPSRCCAGSPSCAACDSRSRALICLRAASQKDRPSVGRSRRPWRASSTDFWRAAIRSSETALALARGQTA